MWGRALLGHAAFAVFALATGSGAAGCGSSSRDADTSGAAATSDAPSAARGFAGGEEASLVRFEQENREARTPVMKLSEWWTRLAASGKRDVALRTVAVWAGGLVRGWTADGAASLLEASFGIPVDGAVRDALRSESEDAVARAVGSLIERSGVDSHPERLDAFPTVPIELVPSLQSAVLAAHRKPDGVVSGDALRPYPRATGPFEARLRRDGCAVRTLQVAPFVSVALAQASDLYKTERPNDDGAVECFAENSAALAEFWNRLSNGRSGESVALPLEIDGARTTVGSFAGALSALADAGLVLEVYTTRVFVNFLGVSVCTAGDCGSQSADYASLRFATWFSVPERGSGDAPRQDRAMRFPGEHSELGFLVRTREGKKLAQVRWYFGVPDGSTTAAVYFRTDTLDERAWSGRTHERVDVYGPSRMNDALPWLHAAADVMAGMQAVHRAYQPPADAYGLFVCNDSLGFVVARERQLRGEPAVARATYAFPLVYVSAEASPGGEAALDATLAAAIDAPEEEARGYRALLRALAPADPTLLADDDGMRARLRATYPAEQDARRLRHFADFQFGALRKIR